MSRPRSAAVRLVGGLAWVVAAAAGASSATAQENPMLGSWTAVDPATGIREVLTVTPEAITFGAAPPRIPSHVAPPGGWSRQKDRRVGNGGASRCRSGGSRLHKKKKTNEHTIP